MKYKSVLVLILFTTSFCIAQRVKVLTYRKVPGDSTKSVKVKQMNHYLGVQANQLLNQLFNFGNSSVAVTNPYLIIYSMNSIKTGWGLNAGLGYNVNTTTDNSDPNTQRKTTTNDFSVRLGIEKKSFLSKKWLASYGLDLLYGKQSDETTATSQFQFNSNSTDTNSSTKSSGLGPRLALSYFISEKIILGTEATYYYKWVKVSQKITNTSVNIFVDPNTGQTVVQESSSSQSNSVKSKDFTFSVPVSIFLILKL